MLNIGPLEISAEKLVANVLRGFNSTCYACPLLYLSLLTVFEIKKLVADKRKSLKKFLILLFYLHIITSIVVICIKIYNSKVGKHILAYLFKKNALRHFFNRFLNCFSCVFKASMS